MNTLDAWRKGMKDAANLCLDVAKFKQPTDTDCVFYHNEIIKAMNTEQTLAAAENQLERDEEARSCEHEYQRISVSTAEDGTQFSNCVCIHCNDQKQFEI